MGVWGQVSKYAPQSLKQAGLYQRLSRERRLRSLRRQIAAAQPLRIVIGSGPTAFAGWLATDQAILDITSPSDWSSLFAANSIDRLLAEHVLEHLSEADCVIALRESYRYLKRPGLFRIAVPDGYRRDPVYVAEVSPPHDGHQVLCNVDSLTALLESVGFVVTPLEYFDAKEEFHSVPWDEQEGHVYRSLRFDSQVAFQRGKLFFTSLIVDARKI
jgi:predicted SAM-dependent methyltransferase